MGYKQVVVSTVVLFLLASVRPSTGQGAPTLSAVTLAPQSGHTNTLTDIAFSPDGLHLFAAGADNRISVWDVASRQEVSFLARSAPVGCLCMDPNGTFVAAGDLLFGATASLLDARTLRPVRDLADPPKSVSITGAPDSSHIAVSPDGRRVARNYWGSAVLIQDALTGALIHAIDLKRSISDIAFAPDGKSIAVLGSGGSGSARRAEVTILGVDTGQVAHSWPIPGRLPAALRYVTQTHLVIATFAAADLDKPAEIVKGEIDVRESDRGELLKSVACNSTVERIIVSRSAQTGTEILAGLFDGGVDLYDGDLILKARTERIVNSGRHYITGLSVSPDGLLLATGQNSGEIKLWTMPDLYPAGEIASHARPVVKLGCSADCTRLVAATRRAIIVWSPIRLAAEYVIPLAADTEAIAIAPDGDRAAVALSDHSIAIWSLSGGGRPHAPVAVVGPHHQPIRKLAFSPDGAAIASLSSNERGDVGEGRVWSAVDGKQVGQFPANGYQEIALAPRGAEVALWEEAKGECRRWDPKENRLIGTPLDPGFSDLMPSALAYSDDGRRLALGAVSGLIVWNTGDGRVRFKKAVSHNFGVTELAWSKDGETLATADWDNCIKLWRASDGASLGALHGNADKLDAIVFARAKGVLVSASRDGTSCYWDTTERSAAVTLIYGDGGESVAVLPDLTYACPRTGFLLTSFRVNDHSYPFDSFDLVYNRPDLILGRFARLFTELGPLTAIFNSASREHFTAYLMRCQRRNAPAGTRQKRADVPVQLPVIQ